MNDQYRRGITFGHLGVYLEQGAVMTDCNVSKKCTDGGIGGVQGEFIFDVNGVGSHGELEYTAGAAAKRDGAQEVCVCKDNVVVTLGDGGYRLGLVPMRPEGGTAAPSGVDGTEPGQWNQMVSS